MSFSTCSVVLFVHVLFVHVSFFLLIMLVGV
jgi:hypothetical protein